MNSVLIIYKLYTHEQLKIHIYMCYQVKKDYQFALVSHCDDITYDADVKIEKHHLSAMMKNYYTYFNQWFELYKLTKTSGPWKDILLSMVDKYYIPLRCSRENDKLEYSNTFCYICKRDYNQSVRMDGSDGPCYHYFCTDCFTDMAKENDTVCPICYQDISSVVHSYDNSQYGYEDYFY